MQRFYQQLQQEIKDLKMHKKLTYKDRESENPYPWDKCKKCYKSAGLLVRHVKDEHEPLPVTRP